MPGLEIIMTSSDLSEARMYEKRRQWDSAVDQYRKYIANCGSDITAYIGYARCLRNIGDTSAAARVLDKLTETHPFDEAVLREQAALYESLMAWGSAKATLQKLSSVNPRKPAYYFRLGRAQVGLRELEGARESYKSGLTYSHTQPYDDIIHTIQNALPASDAPIRTTYSLPGGLDNLGALIHQTDNKKYFTKIVQLGKHRERLFYEGLLQEHPQLHSVSPEYVDSHDIDGFLYLTMAALDPATDQPELSDIIEISHIIQSVHFDDMGVEYSNPEYKFQLDLNTPSVVKGFAHIHEQRYNRQLFATLHRLVPAADDAETAEYVVNRLEDRVMGRHLYALISPREHYRLLHGDFKPANIMASSDGWRVIDWQGFRIGPRFLDVAKYVVHAKTPYPVVKERYLSAAGPEPLTTVEQIFFLYTYILMVLLTSMRKPLNTGLAIYIEPALTDMDAYITRLQNEGGASLVSVLADYIQRLETQLAEKESEAQELSDKVGELTVRVNGLEREKRALRTKSRALKRRLKRLEKSTSWRLTAPLRRLATLAKRRTRKREQPS